MQFDDFKILEQIGTDNYGNIFQAQNTKTFALFSMKCIEKEKALQEDTLDSVMLQKQILLQIDNCYIQSMQYIFEDEKMIYFVMDFADHNASLF